MLDVFEVRTIMEPYLQNRIGKKENFVLVVTTIESSFRICLTHQTESFQNVE